MLDRFRRRRSEFPPQVASCRLIDRKIFPEHDAVRSPGRIPRYEFLEHVPAHAFRIALERLAPSAASPGANDDFGIRGHRLVAAAHRGIFALAGAEQIVAAGLSGTAAPQAPRGAAPAVRPLEIPFSVDEVAHLHVDSQASPELAGACGIAPQGAGFHEY